MTTTWREAFYARAADQEARGPQLNELATGRAANLTAGWGIYNGQTIPIYDERGQRHMITAKQHAVYLWALTRIAADDCNTSMRKAALELGCCVQTVSNTLRRMMAWGKLGYLSSKGRYGGITLFGRWKGDGLDRFTRLAREALRAFWERRLSTKSNVHTWEERRTRDLNHSTSTYGVDIRIERAERLADALGLDPSRGSGRAACPAHGEHRNKTLSWKRTHDGRLLVHCFAGCTYDEIRSSAGV
jgi:hypothetical protein